MTRNITFTTTEFENTHGRKPQGRGYWAFAITGRTFFPQGEMTYSEAKKLAIAEANKRGGKIFTITVLG